MEELVGYPMMLKVGRDPDSVSSPPPSPLPSVSSWRTLCKNCYILVGRTGWLPNDGKGGKGSRLSELPSPPPSPLSSVSPWRIPVSGPEVEELVANDAGEGGSDKSSSLWQFAQATGPKVYVL